MNPLPVFPPAAPQPEPDVPSVEEIQAALAQVRHKKLQLEQREQQLLQALAWASRGRLREMVEAAGVDSPALEGLLRRAVASSHRGAPAGAPMPGATAEADRVRKAALRFRHPDAPGLVWSGRGKTPRWVLELQGQGRLDEARIAADD